MNTPLVSIVLPTYNRMHSLQEAVQSCLGQTFPDWELIIVDDASQDGTPSLTAKMVKSDPRIRVIRHDQNRNLPTALNTGFKAARGQYHTWTSDDNLYRSTALVEMVQFLTSHPDVDLVYASATHTTDESGAIKSPLMDPPEQIWDHNIIGACFLYRQAVYAALAGYDTSLFRAEDYDFWLRASLKFNLHPLQKDLYIYRHHTGSLSKQIPKCLAAIEQALNKNLPELPPNRKKQRAQALMALTQIAFHLEEWHRARTYFSRALICSPLLALRSAKLPMTAKIGIVLGPRTTRKINQFRGGRPAPGQPKE